jgi:hypothetical protein
MPDDRAILLLEEIRDLQKQQLEISQKSFNRYEQAVNSHNKEVSRGKKAQVAFFVILLLFMLFVIYAEWFMNGIPKPSWIK